MELGALRAQLDLSPHWHPVENTTAQLQWVALHRSREGLEDQVGGAWVTELNQGSSGDPSNYCCKGVVSRAARDLFSFD